MFEVAACLADQTGRLRLFGQKLGTLYHACDDISDVLRYVQYEPKALVEHVRRTSEKALRDRHIGLEAATRLRAHYARGLRDYTYLSRDDDSSSQTR